LIFTGLVFGKNSDCHTRNSTLDPNFDAFVAQEPYHQNSSGFQAAIVLKSQIPETLRRIWVFQMRNSDEVM
jgi:hypothetical protein